MFGLILYRAFFTISGKTHCFLEVRFDMEDIYDVCKRAKSHLNISSEYQPYAIGERAQKVEDVYERIFDIAKKLPPYDKQHFRRGVLQNLFAYYDDLFVNYYVREGIEIAKAQGKYTGRKPIEIDWIRFGQLYGEWKSKSITGRDFMRRMGLSANTFYRRVREYESTHGIAEPTSA